MIALPHLELADVASGLDEAVITIGGREEDQIIVSCENSLELADRLVRYVNAHDQVVKALTAAAHALRSYEYGNASPDLARDIAAHCDTAKAEIGAAA